MSEIERAARAWARYKRDAVGTPAGYELDLLRAIESTPPEPVVTLTVEEAEALIGELNAGDRTGAADDLRARVEEAKRGS